MPHGGPNLGKIARMISVVLSHVGLLFVQCDSSSRTSKAPPWPHRCLWFPATESPNKTIG